MAKVKRKKHGAKFKAKAALEAIKGEKTIAELSKKYSIHPTQISKWKSEVLERIPEIFASRAPEKENDDEELIASLYQEIGKLTIERDWLKKKVNSLD